MSALDVVTARPQWMKARIRVGDRVVTISVTLQRPSRPDRSCLRHRTGHRRDHLDGGGMSAIQAGPLTMDDDFSRAVDLVFRISRRAGRSVRQTERLCTQVLASGNREPHYVANLVRAELDNRDGSGLARAGNRRRAARRRCRPPPAAATARPARRARRPFPGRDRDDYRMEPAPSPSAAHRRVALGASSKR